MQPLFRFDEFPITTKLVKFRSYAFTPIETYSTPVVLPAISTAIGI